MATLKILFDREFLGARGFVTFPKVFMLFIAAAVKKSARENDDNRILWSSSAMLNNSLWQFDAIVSCA